MAQYFHIHPTHPQPRLIKRAVEIVRAGGVIAYPTDSSYALGCHIGDKEAMERIRRIRRVDAAHNFTLVCRDLSEVALYARVSNADFRILKAHTPGPYTFILPATKEVPRRLQHAKRKTIGLRVPDHPIARALLTELNEPLMSSTLILPGDVPGRTNVAGDRMSGATEELPLSDPEEIRDKLEHQVDLVIDGGFCGLEPTTVVELEDGRVRIARIGKADPALLLPA
jgi:tRNA threonylcarbamoyl adenosine modification protein (Sua5/YciO/YrdC/YwlC family)